MENFPSHEPRFITQLEDSFSTTARMNYSALPSSSHSREPSSTDLPDTSISIENASSVTPLLIPVRASRLLRSSSFESIPTDSPIVASLSPTHNGTLRNITFELSSPVRMSDQNEIGETRSTFQRTVEYSSLELIWFSICVILNSLILIGGALLIVMYYLQVSLMY